MCLWVGAACKKPATEHLQFKMQGKKKKKKKILSSSKPQKWHSGAPKSSPERFPLHWKSQAPSTGSLGDLAMKAKLCCRDLQWPWGRCHQPSSDRRSRAGPGHGSATPHPSLPIHIAPTPKKVQSGYAHSKDLVFISICPAITVLSQKQKTKTPQVSKGTGAPGWMPAACPSAPCPLKPSEMAAGTAAQAPHKNSALDTQQLQRHVGLREPNLKTQQGLFRKHFLPKAN